MFKKTIKFEDFNGQEQTRDFYFHLSKAELMALASDGENSMQSRVKRITESQDGIAVLNEFRALIQMSVGMRSEDGSRFIKSDAAKSELLDSPAFDALLMELITVENGGSDFVQQLVPEKMMKEILDQAKAAGVPKTGAEEEDKRPAYQKENRAATRAELEAMSKEELVYAMAWAESRPR